MKKFKLPLQPLRFLLERQEETALLHYVQKVSTLEQLKKQLRALQHEFEAVSMLVQSRLSSRCPTSELIHLQDYCCAVEKDKKARERELCALHQQVQLAYARLLAARKAGAILAGSSEIRKGDAPRRRQKKVFQRLANPQPEDLLPMGLAPGTVWN